MTKHKKDRERVAAEFRDKTIKDVTVDIQEDNRAFEPTGLRLTFDDGSSVRLEAETADQTAVLNIRWPDA